MRKVRQQRWDDSMGEENRAEREENNEKEQQSDGNSSKTLEKRGNQSRGRSIEGR